MCVPARPHPPQDRIDPLSLPEPSTVLFVLNSRKHLREYHGEMSSSHNKALTTNRRMFVRRL